MHQNAFNGRAPPDPIAGLKGKGRREGRGVGKRSRRKGR